MLYVGRLPTYQRKRRASQGTCPSAVGHEEQHVLSRYCLIPQLLISTQPVSETFTQFSSWLEARGGAKSEKRGEIL